MPRQAQQAANLQRPKNSGGKKIVHTISKPVTQGVEPISLIHALVAQRLDSHQLHYGMVFDNLRRQSELKVAPTAPAEFRVNSGTVELWFVSQEAYAARLQQVPPIQLSEGGASLHHGYDNPGCAKQEAEIITNS